MTGQTRRFTDAQHQHGGERVIGDRNTLPRVLVCFEMFDDRCPMLVQGEVPVEVDDRGTLKPVLSEISENLHTKWATGFKCADGDRRRPRSR